MIQSICRIERSLRDLFARAGAILIFVFRYLPGLVGASERPNVLFIAIDDLNDWVGCVGGHSQVPTPNLDKFNAQGGMVMFDAHCPSTVCGPSRSSLLTGKYPHQTGVYGNANNLRNAPKAKDLLTLPQYFRAHGYHTLSKGKIFHKHPLPTDKDRDKGDQGQWAFDEWHPAKGGVGPIGKERPVNKLSAEPGDESYHAKAFDWGPPLGNDETKMKDYITAEWTAEQLKTRDFDNPFLMAMVGIGSITGGSARSSFPSREPKSCMITKGIRWNGITWWIVLNMPVSKNG